MTRHLLSTLIAAIVLFNVIVAHSETQLTINSSDTEGEVYLVPVVETFFEN